MALPSFIKRPATYVTLGIAFIIAAYLFVSLQTVFLALGFILLIIGLLLWVSHYRRITISK